MIEKIQLSILLYNLGRWAGLSGFTCLSLLIFSGDTARFFDKYFGLDKIIKFQRKFSLITSVFIIFHPIFFILSTQDIMRYIIPNFAVIPLALGIIAFYIFVIIMTASQLAKRISYVSWQYLHVLTYVLFFFGLYHAVNWGSDSNIIYLKIWYDFVLILIIFGALYRIKYKLKNHYAGKFHVKEIKQETNNVFTLILNSEKKFKFKAGQFCFLRINKNKLYARHPFTISSAPRNKNLQFTIKQTGRFTKTASELSIGEEIIIDGPFGNFTKKNKNNKNLVFIAGGVGITPFMSIIRDHVNNNKNQNILLLYATKTKQDIIFKDELDCLQKKWFKRIYILSQEKLSSPEYHQGRLTKTIIKKYVNNLNNSFFYLCGPKAMQEYTKQALLDLGVKKHQIFIENFFW